MQYVLPIPNWLRNKLIDFSRLYAFPAKPERKLPDHPKGFIILDSGAFAQSRSNAANRMDAQYIEQLADHYRLYATGQDRYHCIAPDVYLDPDASMQNFEDWMRVHPTVAPVIQSTKKFHYDLPAIRTQAEFYAPYQPDFVCFSNPGLRAYQKDGITNIVDMIRDITGAHHIHHFGAGWDRADIVSWNRIGQFDSMDSIAYYTTRTAFADSKIRDRISLAIHNAHLANLICGNPIGLYAYTQENP